LGFEWSPQEQQWNKRVEELTEYKEINGQCNIPTNYEANKELGTWVNKQRTQMKKFQDGKIACITAERIAVLDGLGFECCRMETRSGAETNLANY